MKFETRTDEDGKIVLQLGMTHEAGFPVEPDMGTIVNGVQLLVEAVCGISLFELTQAVIEEYVKNGRPPEGWETNESTSDGQSGSDEQGSGVVSSSGPEGDDDPAREVPEGSG